MKTKRKFLSLALACMVTSSAIASNASAVFSSTENLTSKNYEKISELLLQKYGVSSVADDNVTVANSDEELPVLIWSNNDIDSTEVENRLNDSTVAFLSNDDNDEIWLDNSIVVDFSYEEALKESERIQQAIEKKRKISSELYTELNTKFAEKYISDDDLIYISEYSPVVLANLTFDEVANLAASYDTKLIDFYDSECEKEMSVSIPVIRANEVHNTYGFDGKGIKIGQVEPGIPDVTSSQLSPISSRIFTNTTSTSYLDTHATMVASIMVGQSTSSYPAGVAPGATLYSASTSAAGGWMQAFEWLLSKGVNVINASMAFGSDAYNTYGTTAIWIDHIAINHSVHFVKSAGNSGSSGVTSGGMSYNGYAIGNINDRNTTSLTDDVLNSSSSFSTSTSTTYAFKPDLCAPGTNIYTSIGNTSGTSCAAPHVAASIALLCQAKPELKTLQDAVKAILVASVNPNSPYKYLPSSRVTNTTTNCYTKFGAGLLDSYRATWVATNTRYAESNFSPSQSSKTFYMNVSSSDTLMRVSLAYLKNNDITSGSHTSASPTQYVMPNLNLYIYAPNGTLVASSTTTNNVEIAEFVPTTYGTYTIKVEKASTPATANTTYFGISWF